MNEKSKRYVYLVALGASSGCLGQPEVTQPAEGTSSTTTFSISESSGTTESAPALSCELPEKRCDSLDVLFVIDNSGSMADDNAQVLYPSLLSNYAEFVRRLTEGICSFHIGVTSTEASPDFQRQECQVRGALSRGGALGVTDLWPNDPDHPPWLSESDMSNDDNPFSFDDSLLNLLAVGEFYDDDEKQFETILTSIGPDLQGPGGCNEGFMREGVPLVIVLITDEDDDDDIHDEPPVAGHHGSEGGPEQWFQYLVARKPLEELGMVVVAPTNSDCQWQPGEFDGTGAEHAVRIMQFVSYFAGFGYGEHIRTVDLCEPDLDLVEAFGMLDPLLGRLCTDA